MQPQELNIAQNIRALERLKAEMLESLAALFKGLIKNGTEEILDSMAGLVICCFLLAKRVGFSFGQVEQQVYHKVNDLAKGKKPHEDWQRDITLFKEYLDIKK